MAARKPTKSEIFINILFWAAMTISVVGLFVYGGFQIYRWWNEKSFHFFKLSAEEAETPEESSEEDSMTTKHLSVNDFLDMDIKPDVESYIQQPEKPPFLVIDYTPTLNALMSKTNRKAYVKLLQKNRDSIIRHLKTLTEEEIDFVQSDDAAATSLLIKNPPQELLDYYTNLAKHPIDARTNDEFCEILIKLALKKHDGGEHSLIIELDPKELIAHPLYQSLNEFIKLTGDKKFKSKALYELFSSLQAYIAKNYNKAELYLVVPAENDKPTRECVIPKGAHGHYGEDELEIFLTEYRKKHPLKEFIEEEDKPELKHSADPTFSAKGARKLSKTKSDAELKKEEEREELGSDIDSQSESAPSA